MQGFKKLGVEEWIIATMFTIIMAMAGYIVKSDKSVEIARIEKEYKVQIAQVEKDLKVQIADVVTTSAVNTSNIALINSRFDRLEVLLAGLKR